MPKGYFKSQPLKLYVFIVFEKNIKPLKNSEVVGESGLQIKFSRFQGVKTSKNPYFQQRAALRHDFYDKLDSGGLHRTLRYEVELCTHTRRRLSICGTWPGPEPAVYIPWRKLHEFRIPVFS